MWERSSKKFQCNEISVLMSRWHHSKESITWNSTYLWSPKDGVSRFLYSQTMGALFMISFLTQGLFIDHGAFSYTVLHLAETIQSKRNHLYFDNWSTSVPLVKDLAEGGIWCWGTVRPCLLPSLKLASDADMRKKGRGTSKEWKSSGSDYQLTAVTLFDNKGVTLLSTFTKSQPTHSAWCQDKTAKKVVEIPQPNIVKLYNTNMGGLDLVNCLLPLYRIQVQTKKDYHRLIFHVIDTSINQAWLIYWRDFEANKISQEKKHSLLTFRKSESLISGGKVCA